MLGILIFNTQLWWRWRVDNLWNKSLSRRSRDINIELHDDIGINMIEQELRQNGRLRDNGVNERENEHSSTRVIFRMFVQNNCKL